MINLFFIVDGKKLQAQAYFLATSILEHMAGKCRYLAYVRPGTRLPASLEELFEKAEISVKEIPGGDPDPWHKPYPIGNKLLAAADDRGGDMSVFLDTDTFFCASVDFREELKNGTVGAVLSDYRCGALPDSGAWGKVYDFMGVDMPKERPGTLRRPNLDYPPYFNAGMVIFRERIEGHDLRVGEEWLRMSLEMDREMELGDWHLNIDQITLSGLGARFGDPTRIMSQKLNYNIMGWGGPSDGGCAIVHYHVFGRIWKYPLLGRPLLDALRKHLGEQAFDAFVSEYRDHLYWRKARQMYR